jgi:hypothetical protein
MSVKHQLFLDIPTTVNTQYLRIVDTSIYNDSIPVVCAKLEIWTPGASVSKVFDVDVDFVMKLTTCQLGLQKSNCDVLQDLPDGNYTVRYSISPNDKVFVEYNHYRVANLYSKYAKQMCEFDICAAEPEADKKKLISDLAEVKSYMDAAKIKAEYCNDLKAAQELYDFANKKLTKVGSSNGCCSSCS